LCKTFLCYTTLKLKLKTKAALLPEAENLREQVHEANITVHRTEAAYYELFHPEVYSRKEQQRIIDTLKKADGLVVDNQRKALDFGAGTGNLTGKLLSRGYAVTAVDISPEMCSTLRKKFKSQVDTEKLVVVNAPVEDVNFGSGVFDLVACYSVLHHLPDYDGGLRRLCGFLKEGGAMYLDHEASPYYWSSEPTMLGEIVKAIYFHSNPIINSLYFQLLGFKVPSVDYELSDYWHKKDRPLDHRRIQRIFKEEKFEAFSRTDYFGAGTWVFNPVFPVYRHVCRPEMSCWIAKK
jgi:ubiquinone/menaquinone biosynthesis C-methylase UbiE